MPKGPRAKMIEDKLREEYGDLEGFDAALVDCGKKFSPDTEAFLNCVSDKMEEVLRKKRKKEDDDRDRRLKDLKKKIDEEKELEEQRKSSPGPSGPFL